MLKVQEFLLNNGEYANAITELKKHYKIDIKEYPDRIVLNYNQIESPKYNDVADDCRGLILSKDFKTVLSRPFTRFYNYGEGSINKDFDFGRAEIFEKCDGSLMNCYYDSLMNRWQPATRKMAFAEGSSMMGTKFEVLFAQAGEWPTMASMKRELEFLLSEWKKYTWIFELVGPENRVVKRYDKAELILLGVRHNDTGDYMDLDKALKILNKRRHIARLPLRYDLNDYDSIKKSFENLGSLDEGYVCYDKKSGQRVKIKTEQYLMYHRMNNNWAMTKERILECVFINEHEEFLATFPEHKQRFDEVIKEISVFLKELEEIWNTVKNISDRKEFALKVKSFKGSSLLFKMFGNANSSILKIFNSLETKDKVKYFI